MNRLVATLMSGWPFFKMKIDPSFTAKGIDECCQKLDILSLSTDARRAYERYEENTL